jgi:Flp pilus assembly protein TadD
MNRPARPRHGSLNARRLLTAPIAPPVLLLITVAGTLGACATDARHTASTNTTQAPIIVDRPADSTIPRAIWVLRTATPKSPKSPPSSPLPPPPGIDATRITAASATDANASRTLDEVVPELAKSIALPTPTDAEPTDEARSEAVRLYINGRTALASGDAQQAQTLLTEAAGKDPTAAAVWRELAEAQLRLGRRTLATSSYLQAARRGLDESRVWLALGRDAQQRSDSKRAAAFFAKARLAPDADADAGMPFVIDAELGQSLLAQGYSTAAASALAKAADLPDTFTAQTNLRQDLGEVYRRRGELLELAGDIALRLGDNAAALERYTLASKLPSLDAGSSLLRLVYASALLGEETRGAEALIDRILASGGWIEDRQLLLVNYLATNTDLGPALARAFAVLPQDLADANVALTPTLESRLLRARAAADTRNGVALLRDHLATHPRDTQVAADLFARLSTSPNALATQALAIADAAPQAAVRLADALVAEGRGLSSARDTIRSRASTPGQKILQSWLELRLGRADLAWKAAESVNAAALTDPEARAVALGVKLRAALDTGNFAAASDVVDALRVDEAIPLSLRASSLLDAGDVDTVKKLAAAYTTGSIPEDADERIGTAELLARHDRATDAADLLNLTLATDRYDERAHQSLLALYLPGGPLRDDAKIASTSRALRDAIPTSRVIRWLATGELAQRELWTQAEASLIALSEESSPDPALIDQLVICWERQNVQQRDAVGDNAVLNRASAWLDAKLQRHPESVYLLAAKARIDELSARPADADKRLAALLEKFPIGGLSRQRERLLRGPLQDPAAADKLALARLDHLPRSVDESLELAELHAAAGRNTETAKAISQGIPADVVLNTAQRDRLLAFVNQQAAAATKDEKGAAAAEALTLLDHVATLRLDLPRAVREARLTLLATHRPTDVDALVAAASELARLFPDGSTQIIARTADRLTKSAAPSGAPRFLRDALPAVKEPTTQLYAYLFYFLTARYGTAADIAPSVALLSASERTQIVPELAAFQDQDEVPAAHEAKITHILYRVANNATLESRTDLAVELYKAVLARDPNHAMAANNLAYHYIEFDGDLAEAERLLLVAYTQNPTASSILDSFGWLRYHQGRLKDGRDDVGNLVEPGALSLLARALETPDGADNAVIADHYGDALWSAGEKQKAKDMWELARVSGKRTVDQINSARSQPGVDPEAFQVQLNEFKKTLNGVDEKLKAVAENREPPITPKRGVK